MGSFFNIRFLKSQLTFAGLQAVRTSMCYLLTIIVLVSVYHENFPIKLNSVLCHK